LTIVIDVGSIFYGFLWIGAAILAFKFSVAFFVWLKAALLDRTNNPTIITFVVLVGMACLAIFGNH